MRQFLSCNGCGNQIPIQELHQGEVGPEFLDCENCGERVSLHVEPAPQINDYPPTAFELELEAEEQESETEVQVSESDSAVAETQSSEPDQAEMEVAQLTQPDEAEGKSPEPALDWSVLGPAVPRRRQKEVSALRKIVPPVLGGLAAFPIATLIMWYGFGKDIGSTGKTVSQYVPWIVPKKFHASPWEYSSREFGASSSPRGTLPSSNSNTRNTLPTLNRENPAEAQSDRSKPADETAMVDTKPPMPKSPVSPDENTDNETPFDSSKPGLSETIARLRTLQMGWETTPVAERAQLLQDYCASITKLSEQFSKLRGPSANVWRKDLQKLAREILSHAKIPKAIQLGAMGKLSGVPSASPDGFMATVINVGDGNDPKPNESWNLNEPWTSGQGELTVEVLPGAWPGASTTLPANCLVFGQLVKSETLQAGFVLKAHLILPQ